MSLTEEQLYADAENDGIPEDLITQAKNGDGDAMVEIGNYYNAIAKDKLVAWYILAADKPNNSFAQSYLATMYYAGKNFVPVDYLLAMKWFLRAAVNNDQFSAEYIGQLFENGYGVPVDKYKALEWYIRWNENSYRVKELIEQGIQLTQQDKDKAIEQLAIETEDLAWPGIRFFTEKQLREENDSLKQQVKKMQEESRASGSKK